MLKMSRRSRIIELALAKSEITDPADANTGRFFVFMFGTYLPTVFMPVIY